MSTGAPLAAGAGAPTSAHGWDEPPACVCCCAEHTFGEACPAYAFGTCRGYGALTRREEESWAAHYAAHHGMARAAFFGHEPEPTP